MGGVLGLLVAGVGLKSRRKVQGARFKVKIGFRGRRFVQCSGRRGWWPWFGGGWGRGQGDVWFSGTKKPGALARFVLITVVIRDLRIESQCRFFRR